MNAPLFIDTLPFHTTQLVQLIQKKRPAFLQSFYLSGGTGLSLQLGHRKSEDLDFFNEQSFNPQSLEKELVSLGTLSDTELAEGTLNTFLGEVKLQFLEYPYPTIEPFIDWEGIRISSILDIACTKLQTVSRRGSKKDFVDLYFCVDRYPLSEILHSAQKKYATRDYSQTHILKSLVYFADAEEQPMPRMRKPVQWEEVKEKLVSVVRSIPLT